MFGSQGLDLLLALLLPMVNATLPGARVRLNKAALNYVSDIGKAPLERALRVPVPDFLDQSGEVLQSIRIQIQQVHVSSPHLKFVAGFGVHVSAMANFTIQVFRVLQPLEMLLPVALQADVRVAQASIRTPEVSVSSCFSLFSPARVLDGRNSSFPALLVPVQNHIQAVLRNKLCLQISSLVQGLNVHLGTLIGLNPVGPESQIRYFMANVPIITSDSISLEVRAVLFLLGKPLAPPLDAASFLWPWPRDTTGAPATVTLSQQLFDYVLLLMQKAGTLNLDITGQLSSDNNPLNTSELGQLIPEVAHLFLQPRPLVLKVQLGATPVLRLHPNNATLTLQPLVDVLATSSNSAFQSLFSLDVVVNLKLQFSASEMKLRGMTSVLGGVQISVATSNVGSIEVDQIHTLMCAVFEKPLLYHLNGILGMGIALPSMVNLHYANPEVSVYEGYVVISSGLSYQH
ncbi:BPI fold-containing family B member 2 [Perognathus longimembris pacificus]|uniref:BPI fold-containing family B member 2 n=1 Tax=Perognathus longimembris pacificus TaxID=214514 RepID=UPI002018992C|nr:BPI fold-containing family B member 2 [Perognathus longimembris pacificus]